MKRMTFGDHLEELRRRILRALAGAVVAVIVCFVLSRTILGVVVTPIYEVVQRYDGSLVWLRVQEGFLTSIKVAVVTGLFVASPWIGGQLWAFVAEGLYPHEKKWVRLFAPITLVLFAAGVLFCYFVILPWGLDFLVGYGAAMTVPGAPEGTPATRPTISCGEYLSFFLTISILMGIVFQLPLVMFFLDRVGIVRARTFAKYRRHFLVGAFVVAALLTPPDPVTQVFVAIPVILLFESGILLSRLAGRKDASG